MHDDLYYLPLRSAFREQGVKAPAFVTEALEATAATDAPPLPPETASKKLTSHAAVRSPTLETYSSKIARHRVDWPSQPGWREMCLI